MCDQNIDMETYGTKDSDVENMGSNKLDMVIHGTKRVGHGNKWDQTSWTWDFQNSYYGMFEWDDMTRVPWQICWGSFYFLSRRVVRVTGSWISAFQIPGIPHFRFLDFHMSRFLAVQIAIVSVFWIFRFHIVNVFVWDELTRVPWQLFSVSTCSGQLFMWGM